SNEVALEPSPASAAEPARTDTLLELVRFGNRVRELGLPELAQQYETLAFGEAYWSDEAAIRLSLLLSTPNTPFHDVDQATRTLRDVIDGGRLADREQKDFATLVHHLLSERV